MKVEIVGKFYDNHSLSIINRNLAILLKDKCEVLITPFDAISPEYGVPKETLKILKSLCNTIVFQIFKLGILTHLFGVGLLIVKQK